MTTDSILLAGPAQCDDEPDLLVSTVRSPADLGRFHRAGRLHWSRERNLLRIAHPYSPADISDAVVVEELTTLVEVGAISGQEEFEATAAEFVGGCADNPRDGWLGFYANSVRELRAGAVPFSAVHRRARRLLVGESVLEVGCCFGFFALQCASDGFDVTATDICAGALDLLDEAARDLGVGVQTALSDVRSLRFPDNRFDTVTMIHLLEHLAPVDVDAAIAECCRVARRRVVIAVPYEDEVSPHFGHRTILRERDLDGWATRLPGLRTTIFSEHGGWLVIDLD
ncbi:mycofactocin oligosaccharide methyltransferase MftM [Gordonia neofelifaecis]|uniref:Type 11 methyltransferase n=1 Tax=Gordonia neofelifaecis NRRL B-59395 TaxID=644548 RepID=F1YFE0_9ACTN|nr:mycofactocin oligosaccharide methyltransferase MftM [Gordonia neofelifaecis]EGD56712.1 type 11 methyltransferase [Gordonia neofelifaecis NRRL B-59395]